MILPQDAIIPVAKIRDYLLVRQPDSDKSLYLESAGYSHDDWEQLRKDIRLRLLPLDGEFDRDSPFGIIYAVRGSLTGRMEKN